jgi:type I restriction enzyme S subunit
MSDWKKYKLGDIVTLKRGYDLPQQSRINGKYPIYSSAGLSGFHIKAMVKGPGVITGRYGTLGEVFYSENDYWPHNTTLYVKDFKDNFPRFIYYFLQTLGLNNQNDETSVPGLNRNHLHEMDVCIPDNPYTQTRIASILSSLDDKIELNRRMNQTLEQMAQALFNHYFVDNIDPDYLPEGWRWQRLDELIYIKHGYAFKGEFFTEEPNTNILLTPGNFKIGGGFNYKKFKYYKGDIPLDYVLNWNDLIVTMTDLSKDGDILGYSSLVPEIPNKRLLHNQRIGKVVFKGNENLKFYLNWVLRSDSYRSFVLGSATGTTVKHTSPSRICEYRCIIPTDKMIGLFTKQVEAFSKMSGANEIQCDTLSNVRDTLLPKLMSGEIDVDKK